ncbi:MAG: ribonuclease Z [Bacteroidales bacterium]
MTFSFTSLGIASAVPTLSRDQSAHVVNLHERFYLIDCGEGCQKSLLRAGISPLKIKEIFISHIHGDHIFGLPALLSTNALLGRREPLDIYAPLNFAPLLQFYKSYFGSEFTYEIRHKVVSGDSLELLLETPKAQIYSFPLNHRIACYGYLFKEKPPQRNVYKEAIERENLTFSEITTIKRGEDVVREDGKRVSSASLTYSPYAPRSFAYCSDTAPFEQLPTFVKGCNLIYHEATYMSDMANSAQKRMHSTAAQAAQCAKEGEVGALLLGHFSSRYSNLEPLLQEAKEIFPNSYIYQEGESFIIPLEKRNKNEKE